MPIQNHIHLDTTIGAGPENAPTATWYVRADGHRPIPTIIASTRRTIRGKLKPHVLKVSGQVAQLRDYQYTLRVEAVGMQTADQRFEALLAMQGKTVQVVDSWHVADGGDHTADIRQMFFMEVAGIENLDSLETVRYVTVRLIDDSIA